MSEFHLGQLVRTKVGDVVVFVTGELYNGQIPGAVVGGVDFPHGLHSNMWQADEFIPHDEPVTIEPYIEPAFKVGDIVVTKTESSSKLVIHVVAIRGEKFTGEILQAANKCDVGDVRDRFYVEFYRKAVIS